MTLSLNLLYSLTYMKKYYLSAFTLLLLSSALAAQSADQGSDNGNLFYGGILLLLLFLVVLISTIGGKLVATSSDKYGTATDEGSTNGSTTSNGVSKVFKLNRGFDINLLGEAKPVVNSSVKATSFAIQPTDFRGTFPIPTMQVEVGAKVKAGEILFVDKRRPEMKFASPVSGEVVEIRRGEKRAITEVIINPDNEISYKQFTAPSLEAGRDAISQFLVDSGAWPFFIQRPYDIIANPANTPKGIFISTFDSAPLAPDTNILVAGKEEAFQKGLDVLAKLAPSVTLGIDAREAAKPSAAFTGANGVSKFGFDGPHPSGNVGVQVHHIAPLANGEVFWHLKVQDVITIGNLFLKGIYDAERIVAFTGSEFANPQYFKTYQGANLEPFMKAAGLNTDNTRTISGDVLSGAQVAPNDYLGFYVDQISVLKEGNEYALFGWLIPASIHPTVSNTFIGAYLNDGYKFEANTNTHGEYRAFVMSGEYENVLPMDIYPQHLLKAVITNDIEKMEGLGILELGEEDLALCEFVCTSKQPVQQLLRKGLDMMQDAG